MQIYLGLTFLAFVITFILYIPFINLLYKKKFTRKTELSVLAPSDTAEFKKMRMMHATKAGTPTGGGILQAGVLAVLFVIFSGYIKHKSLGLFSGFKLNLELWAIFFTFVGYGLLGLYDDLRKIWEVGEKGLFVGLRFRQKFAIQWILAFCAAGILYFGLGIDFIHVPFLGIIRLGWGYLLLAAFLIVAFANAFDITDGLDGLSNGLLLVSLMGFWVISFVNLDAVLSMFIALWIGVISAFLYFNIYPARIMLGNTGGLAFGATLAMVGLLSGKPIALLVMGGVFVIDGGSSLIQLLSRRFLQRRVFPIAPIHHWLEVKEWEEPKIVARAWLLGIVLAIFGVWLAVL